MIRVGTLEERQWLAALLKEAIKEARKERHVLRAPFVVAWMLSAAEVDDKEFDKLMLEVKP